MKIILTENVEKLGQAGDVKEVANGYARNFLFPRDLAIPATKGALQEAENRRTSADRRAANQQNTAQAAADRLRGLTVLLYGRTGEQIASMARSPRPMWPRPCACSTARQWIAAASSSIAPSTAPAIIRPR